MNRLSRCRPLLGTYVEIHLEGELADDALVDLSIAAFSEIEKVHALMSFHDPGSELSRLNNQALGSPFPLSPDLEFVLRQALRFSALTDGLYDVTVGAELVKIGLLPDHRPHPGAGGNWRDITVENHSATLARPLKIDLGGIAKGYAVDRAITVLEGNCHAIVNAGGDLRMTRWKDEKVEIKIPGGGLTEFEMLAPALATSASYYLEETSAIISPKTKTPIEDPRSISVFAPDCLTADALTKIAFLLQNPAPFLASQKAQGLTLDATGEVRML